MLPTDAQARKDIPVYSGFIKYFPDAIAAVAELSQKANEQHNPGTPVHWDRSKSADEMDAQMRHVIDMAGGTEADTDGVLHATKNAWRAMANLQKLLEKKALVAKVEACLVQPTRTQSIPAAERQYGPYEHPIVAAALDKVGAERMPMTAEEEALPALEYPSLDRGRATRWLMRDPEGGFWATLCRWTPRGLDNLKLASIPVSRIEEI